MTKQIGVRAWKYTDPYGRIVITSVKPSLPFGSEGWVACTLFTDSELTAQRKADFEAGQFSAQACRNCGRSDFRFTSFDEYIKRVGK